MRTPPISDYALLSDCHSALLVSREGEPAGDLDTPSVYLEAFVLRFQG